MKQRVEDIKKDFSAGSLPDITILTDDLRQQLEDLANTNLSSVNYTKYKTEVQHLIDLNLDL